MTIMRVRSVSTAKNLVVVALGVPWAILRVQKEAAQSLALTANQHAENHLTLVVCTVAFQVINIDRLLDTSLYY